MSIFEHARYKIFNPGQHPLIHDLSAFGYTNNALPGVSNLTSALDSILAVLYPRTKAAVATVGDLPAVGNTALDYRVVYDDGDGKAASYRWEKREGDVAYQWYKIYDMDWGEGTILSDFLDKTQEVYYYKHGYDDQDATGAVIVGTLAGQTLFGGASASTNLTLKANSGDGVGAQTGYVQTGDHFRPINNNLLDIGTATEKFKTGYFGTSLYVNTLLFATGSITDSTGAISFDNENIGTTGSITGNTVVGTTSGTFGTTLTLASGSITDSTGSIGFGNENLSTTGTLGSGTITVSSTLVLASGSITDTTGAISFGNENLSTTGTLGAGVTTVAELNCDNINVNGNSISILNVDGNLNLIANGTGKVDVQSAMTTLGQTVTGTLGVTGQFNIDNIRIDANTISSTNTDGNIILDPNGSGIIECASHTYPASNSDFDLGKSDKRWRDLYVSTNIKDGTNTFVVSELMSLKSAVYRDVARTQAAQDGDSLFYNIASGVWLASAPDTEITHSSLSGLTTGDAGHTQFALLAGRAGGQTLKGDTAASGNLLLESTAHATKGSILFKDTLSPNTDASYSGGWLGTDIGDGSHNIRHVYSKGEFKGFRFENYTDATIPASSATSVGRAVFSTDGGKLYIDSGTAFVPIGGANKYDSDLTFNGSDLTKDVDVSSQITDARHSLKQLFDNSNDFELLHVEIKAISATTVRITTNVALPAGSYRLIVME